MRFVQLDLFILLEFAFIDIATSKENFIKQTTQEPAAVDSTVLHEKILLKQAHQNLIKVF